MSPAKGHNFRRWDYARSAMRPVPSMQITRRALHVLPAESQSLIAPLVVDVGLALFHHLALGAKRVIMEKFQMQRNQIACPVVQGLMPAKIDSAVLRAQKEDFQSVETTAKFAAFQTLSKIKRLAVHRARPARGQPRTASPVRNAPVAHSR